MQNTSKLVIIPEMAYASLIAARNNQEASPIVSELDRLDQQVKMILKDPQLPADIKYRQYEQLLTRFKYLKNQQSTQAVPVQMTFTSHPPQQPQVVNQPPRQQPQIQPHGQALQPEIDEGNAHHVDTAPVGEAATGKKLPLDIMDSLPDRSKKMGNILMTHLETHPQFDWDESNHLIIDGSPILDSNMLDLVHDFIRDRPTKQPVSGAKEFAKLLKDTNVSMEVIGNKNRHPLIAAWAENYDSPTDEQTSIFTSPPGTSISRISSVNSSRKRPREKTLRGLAGFTPIPARKSPKTQGDRFKISNWYKS